MIEEGNKLAITSPDPRLGPLEKHKNTLIPGSYPSQCSSDKLFDSTTNLLINVI